jgi:hypothetical protein
MRIDTHTTIATQSLAIQSLAVQSLAVQSVASPGARTGAIPERDFVAREARWVSIAVMVLAATAVLLLASGLAVVMSLT